MKELGGGKKTRNSNPNSQHPKTRVIKILKTQNAETGGEKQSLAKSAKIRNKHNATLRIGPVGRFQITMVWRDFRWGGNGTGAKGTLNPKGF